MSDQEQYFNRVAPVLTRIACIAVTSTSEKPDLSADAYVGKAWGAGEILEFHAEGKDVYIGFFYDDSTVSAIVDTATGDTAGKCARIPAGESRRWCMPWLNGKPCKYLYHKCAGSDTATLRIAPASLSDQNKVTQ